MSFVNICEKIDRVITTLHCSSLITIYCVIHITWFLMIHSFDTYHYNDVTMGAMASQITSLAIVYSTVYSNADERKHQSYASMAFVRGIHRWPVNSPHKLPVTRKMFPFDDIILCLIIIVIRISIRGYIMQRFKSTRFHERNHNA